MNINSFPSTSSLPAAENAVKTPEEFSLNPAQGRSLEVKPRSLSYSEATKRYRELMGAVPDTDKLIFNERPARSNEEQAIAQLELEIDACLGQAEVYAQQKDPHAEREMRMLAQLKEAEKTILGLYCDALQVSEEFANLILQDHPWLSDSLKNTEQNFPEVEFEETLPKEEVEA